MGIHFYILLTWQKWFRLLIIKTWIPSVAINSSPLLSWTPVILNPPPSWTKSHFPLWRSVIYYWLCQTSVILRVEDTVGVFSIFFFVSASGGDITETAIELAPLDHDNSHSRKRVSCSSPSWILWATFFIQVIRLQAKLLNISIELCWMLLNSAC